MVKVELRRVNTARSSRVMEKPAGDVNPLHYMLVGL